MVSKRATTKLRNLGFDYLTVQKGCYGFYLHNVNYRNQRAGVPVRKTAEESIQDAIVGNLPIAE